jgi:hypothetical protein
VPGPVYEEIQTQRERLASTQRATGGHEPLQYPDYPKPVFTFVDKKYLGSELHLKDFVTGSHELMDWLLKGHMVLEGSFYVPFSNCTEINDGPLRDKERAFRTTLQQAVEAFDLFRDDFSLFKS